MYDSVESPVSPHTANELSAECKTQTDKLIKDKPIAEIHAIANYCHDCAYAMSRELEKNITADDFKKIMKDTEREGTGGEHGY